MSESPSIAPEARKRPHFSGFDGLRCLAILPVIWHHSTPRVLPGVLGKGAVGVDLFFVLSGYLITTLLLNERERTGRVALRDFHLRRLSRIAPLYFAILLLQLGLAALSPSLPTSQHLFRYALSHATFTSNIFVDYTPTHPIRMAISWSLSVEMQFYLLWSVCVATIKSRRVLALLLLALIGFDYSIEHRYLFSELPRTSELFRALSSFSMPIGFGSLAALTLASRATSLLARSLRRSWIPLLALAVAGYALSSPATEYPLLCVALTALVASVAENSGGLLRKLLEAKLVARIGVLSYALYLTHLAAIGALRSNVAPLRESAVALFLLALPVCFGIAELAHRGIEMPAQAWLRRRHLSSRAP